MKTTLTAAIAAGVLTWLSLPAAAETAPPVAPVLELPVPEAALHESQHQWYGVYLNGAKSGWGNETRAPGTIDGKPCISSSMHMTVQMKALQNLMKMEMKTSGHFSTEPPYRLMVFEESQKMDGQERTVTVRWKEGTTYTASITEAGKTRTQTLTDIDYRLTHETTPEIWAADPARKAGDTLGSLEFSAERLRLTRQTATLRRETDWAGPGGKLAVWELDLYDHDEKINALTRISRLDGSLVNATFGQIIEVRAEPEAVARQKPGGEVQDLFIATSIQCDRKLGRAEDLDELVLEISAPDGKKVPPVSSTVNQTVEPSADGKTVTIRISRGREKPQPATDAEREEALQATPRYPIGEESVRQLAAKAVGSAKSDREKVRNLLRFTDQYIRDSYEIEALTVMDLMKTRKGDCSAHALMFTALARAAGIPSREAGGWLYMGNQYQSFGGHAWNEVILDGHWVPVDPVWNEFQLNAGHIQQHAGDRDGSMVEGFVAGLKARAVSFKTKR